MAEELHKFNSEKKNITISSEELGILREGVYKKFSTLSEKKIENPEKLFNSNLRNYSDLYDSINQANLTNRKNGILWSINIKSHKPLAIVFYFSKKSTEEYYTFRKKFIDVLYLYAFGSNRDEFVSSAKSIESPMLRRTLENLAGYWECYYDKNGNFAVNLKSSKRAFLGKIAYKIFGTSLEDAKFIFYQSKSKGEGQISYKGGNIFLKSENDVEELFVSLNCGLNVVDLSAHLEKMVGCFQHIDDAGSPKAGRCVFIYTPEEAWDLENEEKQNKFKDTLEFHLLQDNEKKILNDMKAFFFEKETNTITANLNLYKEIVKSPKLTTFESLNS